MTKKPNILFIMCDQLNASVLSCYGGVVPTPNIDRLANQGTMFTNATCPYPVCSPSRASVVTGCYPHSHGIIHNVNRRDYPASVRDNYPKGFDISTEEGIKNSDITTEKILYENGYNTRHFGKWHLLDDDLKYFPDMYLEHDQYAEEMSDTFDRVSLQPKKKWMNWYDWALPVTQSKPYREKVSEVEDKWKNVTYSQFITRIGKSELSGEKLFDHRVADKTIEALKEMDNKSFMITCSFNYPHDHNVIPEPYYDMFKPDTIELPLSFNNREKQFDNDLSRRIVEELGDEGIREMLRIYYGQVKYIDDQVGRVLETLDALGLASETIVVFTADHGDMAGNHGMFWKSTGSFYDDIVRVPLIIRYPGVLSHSVVEFAAGLTDLMPTLLEFTGHKTPDFVQGHSLVPYLTGEKPLSQGPEYSFCERVPANPQHHRNNIPIDQGHYMARGNGWKFIRYNNGETYLYNLKNDPLEKENLSHNEEYNNIKFSLDCEIDKWLERTKSKRQKHMVNTK